MACLHNVLRAIVKTADRSLGLNSCFRGFRSSTKSLAVQNFSMPAMSPTMTEGNIASWKVKEGDSFSTGDVLLEIETDKAQMDVEAQDDGKLAKITQEAGAKGVKVGSRIAIVADQDDDISSLEFPPDNLSAQPPSPHKDTKAKPSTSQTEATALSQSDKSSSVSSRPNLSTPKPQTYPFYPSIAQLLHQSGLPLSEADRIPGSGPKGRLLKGDVLAYLGVIDSSYASKESARITKLGHLDLSEARPAPPKATNTPKPPPPKEASKPLKPAPELDTQISVPISLTSVLSVQKRTQEALGITLPLSTFIARAINLANDELPRSSGSRPTDDELFNDVLGLNKIGRTKTSRGNYMPQISALPPNSLNDSATRRKTQLDIYDLLTESGPGVTTVKDATILPPGIIAGTKPGQATNLFSLSAVRGEEKRARVFLERIKTILQVEPGKLIL